MTKPSNDWLRGILTSGLPLAVVVVSLVAYIVTDHQTLAGTSDAVKTLEQRTSDRIGKLEQHDQDTGKMLVRIEDKIDNMKDKVEKIDRKVNP